jgi:hypothetical protein
MTRYLLILPLIAGFAAPALAQRITPVSNVENRSDCIANFRAADWNGDGALSKEEQQRTPSVIFTSLLNRQVIERGDYLNTCYQYVRMRQS